MFIKPGSKLIAAWTVMEAMIATAVFSIGALGLMEVAIFSSRGFQAMQNYAILDQADRQAMDQVTQEIRQARALTDYSSNAITRSITLLRGSDGEPITFIFDSSRKQLRRTCAGETTVLLNNCSLLNFTLFLRPPATNAFDFYPVCMTGTNWQKDVKVVRLSWKTSLTICPTPNINSEDIQTACVVIRKQQDH